MSVLTQSLCLCDLTSLFIPVVEAYECPLQKAWMSESKQVLSTLYFAQVSVAVHSIFTFDNKSPRYTSIHCVYAYQGELDLSPQLCVSGDIYQRMQRQCPCKIAMGETWFGIKTAESCKRKITAARLFMLPLG